MKKPADTARLGSAELDDKARGLRTQLFGFRLQHAARQLAKPSSLREARRELARVLTYTAAKRRQGGAE